MSWLPRLCKPCFAHINHSCAGRAGADDDWALVLCRRRLTANPVRMVAVQVVPCGRFVNILKNTPGACGFKRPEGYKPVTKAEIIKGLAALNIPVYEVDPKVRLGPLVSASVYCGDNACPPPGAYPGSGLTSHCVAPWLACVAGAQGPAAGAAPAWSSQASGSTDHQRPCQCCRPEAVPGGALE